MGPPVGSSRTGELGRPDFWEGLPRDGSVRVTLWIVDVGDVSTHQEGAGQI